MTLPRIFNWLPTNFGVEVAAHFSFNSFMSDVFGLSIHDMI